MCGELLAKEGEVVLFQGGGSQRGIGVKESAELVDDVCALRKCEPLNARAISYRTWCLI